MGGNKLERSLVTYGAVAVALIVGLTVIVAVLASTDDDGDETEASVPVTGAPAPASSSPTQISFARAIVARYFRRINGRDYAGAWRLLSREARDKFGSYGSWRRWYRTTRQIQAASVSAVANDHGIVSFVVRVPSTIGCASHPYAVVQSGPVSVDTHLRVIDGIRLGRRLPTDPTAPPPARC